MSSGDTTMRPRALEASGDGAAAPYQSHRARHPHVWLIAANDQQLKTHPDKSNKRNKKTSGKKITKNCAVWLTNEMTIWATDLSPQAEPLVASNKPNELPARLAIVIGRETDGVSPEMLRAAHRRVYLPSSASVRGDLDEQEKQRIREKWHPQLVSNPTQAAQAEPWTSGRVPIRPLDDLRREKHEAWVPKSVRRRERKMPEVRERLGKRKQPESEVPSDGSQPDKKE
ncbi:Alpha/beta knot methyltransferase [Phytophthora cactorum]|nr:Alpha/beta knot methyltransferase [Phytophthora cactorum]